MLISCVLQCTDGLRLIKRLENYAYRMSEKTAYRSLEKSAYRSLKKLLTVHLQIHLTACIRRSIFRYCKTLIDEPERCIIIIGEFVILLNFLLM